MKLPIAGLVTAAVMFVIDQAAKYGVTQGLKLDELTNAYYVNAIFNLRFVANRGVSLGLLHADTDTMRWMLVLMTGAIALGPVIWMFYEKNRVDQVALGLVAGGALGNILDRVRFGYVVDFADLHFGTWQPFLVFNTADAAISIGVLILLARALLVRDNRAKDSGAEQGPVENIHA